MPRKLGILIVGVGGRLGAALSREYGREHDVVGLTRAQLDLRQVEEIEAKIGRLEFDLMINCAAQTNVDRCETEREEAFLINAKAPAVLAKICAERQVRLIHISTDYVFDGEGGEPYAEDDAANPVSVYGESKKEGEELVLAAGGRSLVVRVSWVFGPERPSFVDAIIERARTSEKVEAIADKFSTPSYTLDLAVMLKPFLWSRRAPAPDDRAGNDFHTGIMHLTNDGACSWQEYGQWALDCCVANGVALKTEQVGALRLAEMKAFVARRPAHTVLSTSRYRQWSGYSPRPWREAVADYVRDFVTRR